MRAFYALGIVFALVTATPAAADSWKGDCRHKYASHERYRGDWQEQWRDGRCTHVRTWDRDGDYKERVTCYRPYRSYPMTYAGPARPSITIVVPIDW